MFAFFTLAVLTSLAVDPSPAAELSLTAGALPAAQTDAATAPDAAQATYAISSERWFEADYLQGLKGAEHFFNPVGNPLYFETPLNKTGLKLLFLNHNFSDDSQLQGGQVNVIAAQARFAVTERLGIIATKDGYSMLDTGIGIEDDGWNDIAAGIKYVFYIDRESQLYMTTGARIMLDITGEAKVLQGRTSEISPFISFAKGWDKLHLMGNATVRIPFDQDDGNSIAQWDLHLDYEVANGFAPMLELHGLHYLSDGEALPLNVGGLDYSNFGSSNVEGSTVIWAGIGGRVKFNPHTSLGATYEYPLTNRDADIMGDRITVDVELTF